MSECTKANVHMKIAEWAGVPVTQITEQTLLDGLGGKSWPADAPPLISELELLCNCTIPEEDYETFTRVEDIDEYFNLEDEGAEG